MRQANNGRLTLWFKEDPVDSKPYEGLKRKEEIISKWKRLYGPGFHLAVVKDEPDHTKDDKALR